MKDCILDYLRNNPPATVGEIMAYCEERGHSVGGDFEILVNETKFIWAGVSVEFAETVCNLITSRQCLLRRVSLLDFLVTSPRHFLTHNLLPVRLVLA